MNGDEALERYLASLAARDASPHTRRAYATALGAYLAGSEAAGIDWRNPERPALRRYLGELTEGHARTTVAQRLAAIRSLYRWARRAGLVAADPWAALATPRRPRRLPAVLATEEVERLLDAVGEDAGVAAGEDAVETESGSPTRPARAGAPLRRALSLRDVALVETAYAAGLRISELAGARLGSLDLARGEIRVAGKGRKERVGLLGRPGPLGARRVPGRRTPPARRPRRRRVAPHRCALHQPPGRPARRARDPLPAAPRGTAGRPAG